METIVIDAEVIKQHKKEAARRERKQKWENIKKETARFVANNLPEVSSALALVAIGTGRAIVKSAKRHSKVQEELKTKDLRVYDTSLGHYWELRRKLSNREWVEIESRRMNGERLANILSEMNVLR